MCRRAGPVRPNCTIWIKFKVSQQLVCTRRTRSVLAAKLASTQLPRLSPPSRAPRTPPQSQVGISGLVRSESSLEVRDAPHPMRATAVGLLLSWTQRPRTTFRMLAWRGVAPCPAPLLYSASLVPQKSLPEPSPLDPPRGKFVAGPPLVRCVRRRACAPAMSACNQVRSVLEFT